MAEDTKKTEVRNFTSPITILLVLAVFLLAYMGAAWFPETVHSVFQVQGGTDTAKKFDVFGPIGDFFGGIINPILTFITICLLLQSIKIQREDLRLTRLELQVTRDEMKAATAQAEISAKAASDSVKVAKVSERPFLQLCRLENADVILEHGSEYNSVISVSIIFDVKNVGRSVGVLSGVNIYYEFKFGNVDYFQCVNLSFDISIPIGTQSNEPVYLGGAMPADFLRPLKDYDVRNSITKFLFEIEYRDSFGIIYYSSYNLNDRYLSEDASEFKFVAASFIDLVHMS